MAESIVRVISPDDPNRCKGVTNQGQCPNLAVRNGFCPIHFGVWKDPNMQRNYQLTAWQAKLDSKLISPDIKGLREEIGILRMALEARLNACQTETDLILNSQAITHLTLSIKEVVKSCHSIEQSLGNLLDKSQAIQLASEIVLILSEVFKEYPALVEEASIRIAKAWDNSLRPKDEAI